MQAAGEALPLGMRLAGPAPAVCLRSPARIQVPEKNFGEFRAATAHSLAAEMKSVAAAATNLFLKEIAMLFRSMLEILESRRLFNGLPTMTIGDVSLAEGNSGTTSAAMIVRLSEPRPNQPVTVNYVTQNGTAAAGADYLATSGKVTFAVGETSKTILVPVIGDRNAEADEYFIINLQNPKQARIADGQGIITITDDEPRVSIADAIGDEGNSGTTPLNFTVRLSAAYDRDVTVNFSTQDGNAIAGADYQATSGSVTIPAGDTSKAIQVPVIGDRIAESDTYFFVNLQPGSNAIIADGQAFGTIIDDEPRISITGVYDYEGDSGTKEFVFTVNLSRTYDQTVTVDFATQDDSAFAGTDYLANSGPITFAPGDTTKLITVQVIGNTTPEPDKYFLVNLSGASANAMVSSGQAYGTIADDDGYVYDYYDYGYYDYGYYGWYDYGYYGW
jgi:hypothetical protein